MLAFVHWNINPVLVHIGSFGLRYYSLCWVLGFIFGYLLVRKIFIKEKLGGEQVEALFIYVLLGALIGARLGHCLFYDWKYFSNHILELFIPVSFTPSGVKFTGYAGLASHGGAIGVILAVLLYNRKYHIPILSILDKLDFATPVLGALIRIGNFFNSEIIGAPTNVSWAVIFDRVDTLPRHPAQLYEALAYILTFLVLCFAYRYKYKHQGGSGAVRDWSQGVHRHGHGTAAQHSLHTRWYILFNSKSCNKLSEETIIGRFVFQMLPDYFSLKQKSGM